MSTGRRLSCQRDASHGRTRRRGQVNQGEAPHPRSSREAHGRQHGLLILQCQGRQVHRAGRGNWDEDPRRLHRRPQDHPLQHHHSTHRHRCRPPIHRRLLRPSRCLIHCHPPAMDSPALRHSSPLQRSAVQHHCPAHLESRSHHLPCCQEHVGLV